MDDVRIGQRFVSAARSSESLPRQAVLASRGQDSRVLGNAEIALGLLVFATVWLAHLALTSLSPPVDNIEQLTWVRSLEWGYYKHPPLPTWLIWVPARLFGVSAWTSYVLGALFTTGSMWMLWSLLRTLRGTTHATVALLAALCITYYNGRLYYFNHNIVLMLLSTASAVLCWKAFATRQLGWWGALGIALGLGALSKYQVAVTVVCVLAFAIQQRAWRDPTHRKGILLAALMALLLFSPHVEWLRTHEFGPIRYAVESSLGAELRTPATAIEWLVDQVFNRCLPALVLLFAIRTKRQRERHIQTRSPVTMGRDSGSARAFLLIWGMVPLLFMTLLGVVFGVDLQLQWGTAFVIFLVPALMEMRPHAWRDPLNLAKALRVFLLIQGLLLVLNFLTSPRGPAILRDRHWRAFDSAELAQDVVAAARNELGGPIHIVTGPGPEAGALAVQIPERPLVLIDGRFDRSPWVTPDLVKRCGILELGPSQALPLGNPVGSAFPGLSWRVRKPLRGAATCPLQ